MSPHDFTGRRVVAMLFSGSAVLGLLCGILQPSTWATGATVAVSQDGLDYVVSKGLPLLADYLTTQEIPNAEGVIYRRSFFRGRTRYDWSLRDITLSNVSLGGAMAFSYPSNVLVNADVRSLHLAARFDVDRFFQNSSDSEWESDSDHSFHDVMVYADVDAEQPSTAAGDVSVDLNASYQTIVLARRSCTAKIFVSVYVTVSSTVAEVVANLVLRLIHSVFEDALADVVCKALDDGIANANDVLKEHSYQQQLGHQLRDSIIDYHPTQRPRVLGRPQHLQAGFRAEFMPQTGVHPPVIAPAMPALSPANVGRHMVTAQVSSMPFDTALWTAWSNGLLHFDIDRYDFSNDTEFLNTNYFIWPLLLPQLISQYKDCDMRVHASFDTSPYIVMKHGVLLLQGTLLLHFLILAPEGVVPAFTLGSPLAVNGSLFLLARSISGRLKMDAMEFSLKSNHSLVDSLALHTWIRILNPTLNKMLNDTLIPDANDYFIRHAYQLPDINTSVANVSVVNPQIQVYDDFIIVVADVVADVSSATPLAVATPQVRTQNVLI